VQVRYLHDAAGKRVKRLVRKSSGPAESTVTINGIFEQHTRGGLTNSTLHVMDADRRVATIRVGPAFPDDGGADIPVAYQLADALDSGTVTIGGATAAAAGAVRREEYGAWGETTFGSYARKRYRFAGKERDDASGLYDFGARQYAPWLGRWLSADPAGPVDGPNLYTYARDNPLSRVDPTGLQSKEKERDAGAGPTDVSGAGAQQPNAPTATDGTATGSQTGGAGGGSGGAAVAGAGLLPGAPRPGPTPGPVQAPGTPSPPVSTPPGTPSAPARAPGFGPNSFRPGTWQAPPQTVQVPATAPGATTGPRVWAGRILAGPLVILGFGMLFHGDSPVPPATTPTLADLDKAIVEIVKQQNDILSSAIQRHDWSLIAAYTPKRMEAIMRIFPNHPELAYKLFQLAYGKVLELMVDDALRIDDRTSGYFEHRGGANEADWWGHGPIEGLAYDLTTPGAEEKHYDRRYGENLRVIKYKPPWMP
jgi:RHS repeat-associated protein